MNNEYLEIQTILSDLCPRVQISKLSDADEQRFIEMSHKSKTIHMPWVFPAMDSASFHELLDRNKQANFETIVVRPIYEQDIIGIFNLSQIFYHNFQNTILGCYANVAYHGEGYMHEGLLLSVAYAFFQLKLHRIEANIICENELSIRYFKGFGFRYEGMSKNYLYVNGAWRDHEKFALTREDWEDVLLSYKQKK